MNNTLYKYDFGGDRSRPSQAFAGFVHPEHHFTFPNKECSHHLHLPTPFVKNGYGHHMVAVYQAGLNRQALALLISFFIATNSCAKHESGAQNYEMADCSVLSDGSSTSLCEQANKQEKEIKKYQLTTTDLKAVSTEGGLLQRYYLGQNLVIMNVSYFGEMGKRIVKYYHHDDGKPFFAVDVTLNYDRPVYESGRQIDSVDMNYFEYQADKSGFVQLIQNSKTALTQEAVEFVNKVHRDYSKLK